MEFWWRPHKGGGDRSHILLIYPLTGFEATKDVFMKISVVNYCVPYIRIILFLLSNRLHVTDPMIRVEIKALLVRYTCLRFPVFY